MNIPENTVYIRCKACGEKMEITEGSPLGFTYMHEKCCASETDLLANFECTNKEGELLLCLGMDGENVAYMNPNKVEMKVTRKHPDGYTQAVHD